MSVTGSGVTYTLVSVKGESQLSASLIMSTIHHHHHVPGPGSTITTNSILGNATGIGINLGGGGPPGSASNGTGLGLYNLSSDYLLEVSNLYFTGHVSHPEALLS